MVKAKTIQQYLVEILTKPHVYVDNDIVKGILRYCYDLVQKTVKNREEKILVMCLIHYPITGEPFMISIGEHLRGRGCHICGGGSSFRSLNEVLCIINHMHKGFFKYPNLKTIPTTKEIIEPECPMHGLFQQEFRNHLAGYAGCKKCQHELQRLNMTIPVNIVRDICENIWGPLCCYTNTFNDYIDTRSYAPVLCRNCNKIFTIKIKRHIYQSLGCCHCSVKPKGEVRVECFLKENNINYKWQEPLNCRNILPLPFDFYLPDLNICIEYNGIQHYVPIEFFGGNIAFESQQERDKIKIKYCKDNNIQLITIPYWDFDNIEKILTDTIKIT
jgi:hypothetical protein